MAPCALCVPILAQTAHHFLLLAGKEDPSGRAVAGVHDSAYEGAAANGEPASKKAKH